LADLTVLTDEDVKQYLKSDKKADELTPDEKKTVSLEKAKATVGKTIQLEFKEQKGYLDPQEKDKIQTEAQSALDEIRSGKDFTVVAQEESLANPTRVKFETIDYKFENEISSPKLAEVLKKLEPGQTATKELIQIGGTYTVADSGETQENTGLAIVKLIDKKDEVKNAKQVEASHILISYKGASNAPADITRTEEEAYAKAKEASEKLKAGKSMSDVAKYYSDDPSNKDLGGKLSKPVTGDGTYVSEFEKAALALEKDGQISDIIKTEFGYHIIRADKVSTDTKETKYKYTILTYSTVPDPWKDTGLTGEFFKHADVQIDQYFQPYISIQFDDKGAKLFEEITDRNVGKPVAIFVGGNLISAPRVDEKIVGGKAQITGKFSQEEANNLARDLNTGAIPAPVILAGEETVGATLGQNALNVSIWAGLLGFLAVCAFMIIFYRVPGLLACLALSIYAVILLFLIKAQLPLGIALIISITIFGVLVYKTLNAKEHAGEKFITFILSCFILFFITFMLRSGVVLTLAGIAGIILSVGMALDANVLIFARIKEELRAGRSYASAIEEGFYRAWNSIRDSNFSTLITCVILFLLGSSTIKGFAFNLIAGVLVSMFTAITVTHTLLRGLTQTKYGRDPKYFGVDMTKTGITNFKFIKNSKKWFTASGVMIVISIVAMLAFGLRLGIDFTGGTLMEMKFDKEVTKEQLQKSLSEIEDELKGTTSGTTSHLNNNTSPTTTSHLNNNTTSPTTTSHLEQTPNSIESVESIPGLGNLISTAHAETDAEPPVTSTTNPISPIMVNQTPATDENPTVIDLKNAKIVPTENNTFIITTKYLDSPTHDKIIQKLKEKLGKLIESRFTTVGPVIGDTLKTNAVRALVVAMIAIILYIAFAFRKVPKELNKWRFGVLAIVALIHDLIVVTGIFIIIAAITGAEIDALFITALLTILGYSVHDTIVVYDRVRENSKTASRDEKLEDITDRALNQTLGRSLNTTVTVLITVTALFIGSFFGGAESIRYFVLTLIIGLVVGTYSSIFVASSGLIYWKNFAEKRKAKKLQG